MGLGLELNRSDASNFTEEKIIDSPEFLEMKLRAEAAEAKLRRIYNTPIWKLSRPFRNIYARTQQFRSKRREVAFVFKPNELDGTTVLELANGKVRIEANDSKPLGESVVIIAQFSKNPTISESLNRFISGFIANSFSVILVSACESEDLLNLSNDLNGKLTVIRKPNLGYDFGSWAVAFDQFPNIFSANELILTNDSLIGPLSDFSHLLEQVRLSKYDITGITDNSELQYHLQSYFLHFKKNAINDHNVQTFLKSVVHLALKNDVILKYELGLTRTAQLSGLFTGSIYPWNLLVKPGKNPSLVGWSKLIELGFPFIKKEAIRKASSYEKNKITKFISSKFPEETFALSEIKDLSG